MIIWTLDFDGYSYTKEAMILRGNKKISKKSRFACPEIFVAGTVGILVAEVFTVALNIYLCLKSS